MKNSDVLFKALLDAVKRSSPGLPAGVLQATAEEFMDFVDKVTKFLAETKPSPAKGAALMYVVGRLGLENTTPEMAKLMVALVETANSVSDELRQRVKEVREQAPEPKVD